MAVDTQEIQPRTLYSLREAARFIPSPQGGSVNVRTLQRWTHKGLLACVHSGGHRFVYGAELLRFLAADQVEAWHGRTPAERRREVDQAEAELKRMGVL